MWAQLSKRRKEMATYEEHVKETLVATDSAKAEVFRLIESNPSIPEYAKQGVKDFVADYWIQLLSNTLANIPDNMTDYIDTIMEIIKSVKDVMGL
jgi:hypothetical protein